MTVQLEHHERTTRELPLSTTEVDTVTDQPRDDAPHGMIYPVGLPAPTKTPQAIRAVLLPEEVGDFDAGFRRVMAEATETLDLSKIDDFIEHWWVIACFSLDPVAHRRANEIGERLRRGEDVAGFISLEEALAMLGVSR
jgi:hypothetical protein